MRDFEWMGGGQTEILACPNHTEAAHRLHGEYTACQRSMRAILAIFRLRRLGSRGAIFEMVVEEDVMAKAAEYRDRAEQWFKWAYETPDAKARAAYRQGGSALA